MGMGRIVSDCAYTHVVFVQYIYRRSPAAVPLTPILEQPNACAPDATIEKVISMSHLTAVK